MTRDSRILLVALLLCTAVVVATQYYFTSRLLSFNAQTGGKDTVICRLCEYLS
jgi:hypothetical protein